MHVFAVYPRYVCVQLVGLYVFSGVCWCVCVCVQVWVRSLHSSLSEPVRLVAVQLSYLADHVRSAPCGAAVL